MKYKLSDFVLSIGLAAGISAYATAANARLALNGSSLTGKVSRPTTQDSGEHRSKALTFNGSSLNGKKSKFK